ncbi:tRNA (guanosine(18)-2'-O)-methyltransferase TrmH [Glaciecola sp. MH2013]|uniref:tRNA (guanosine(18)-2'-O)-methyltransferase TrmH n=1 Tax=Glaciecola sp. MH2013 TaxID=2785524 RepID=UPI00189EB353|nr:tRNA (guanosine(18)-2'-O)-methyltransferase TrmH [Glaciecola sp. MH2013]MBF7073525.1 tRNA (guanosine(18)-2'-O)-methyltransferase TrmH [Glaciecola sp. MH2013]
MSPERYKRIRQMLKTRQPDLSVCLEEVTKPHNVSAVIRTCDAVGVHKIHAVWDESENLRKGTAMGSQIWVKTQPHNTIQSAVAELKKQNMQVLVTHLDDTACDFRDIDYTKPTAVLLGQEKTGATDEAIALADQSIIVPMVGMVQSLNVSVAAAVVMYEAQRQRELASMYDKSSLSEQECQDILFEGGFPILFQQCKRRGLAFPHINGNGEIEADDAWWKALQYSS